MSNYFSGWYLKCQSDDQTLAVIPAIHQTGRSRTGSVQLITRDGTWNVPYPAGALRVDPASSSLSIGSNRFTQHGFRLDIRTPELTAAGTLHFGPLTPLRYDIMGPFSLVPFLECRHSVRSMRHLVRGSLRINDREYSFPRGIGYWEGDRGRSFPREYAWTQCLFPGGSLMLCAADIPLAGIRFTGILGVILYHGREYRLATYLGAKAVQIGNRSIRIVQGDLELEARLLKSDHRPLRAPAEGAMTRTIRESVSCRAFYRFRKAGRTVFAFETGQASFEYEHPS